VLTDPRLGPPAQQALASKPLILAIARGGSYGPGTPREGWDHATPWLRRIFADVWGMDVKLVEAELTLADVTPGMEPLRDLAAESRKERPGHRRRARHGRRPLPRRRRRLTVHPALFLRRSVGCLVGALPTRTTARPPVDRTRGRAVVQARYELPGMSGSS